jgi:hypothetical protein
MLGRRGEPYESVFSYLLEDQYWQRELSSLPIHLYADIVPEYTPPDLSF